MQNRLFLSILSFFCFSFSLLMGVPVVTNISPSAGPSAGGNTVSISGSGFTGATSVQFGPSLSLTFTVDSDVLITAVAPASVPGTVDITVTAPSGTSLPTSSDLYVYQGTWVAYVTSQVPSEVTPIPIPANIAGTPINMGGGEVIGIALTPDGRFAYVANATTASVEVVDILAGTVVVTIPVGATPIVLAITPDGQKVYVTNSNSNSVSVIQVSSNTVIATIPLPFPPFGIAITPDGATAYVTTTTVGTVIPINIATNTAGAPIPLGFADPGFITMNPNGKFAYVGRINTAGPLFVIDVATNSILTTISLSSPTAIPTYIGVVPDGTKGYVTNNIAGSNTVFPLDLINNTAGAPIVDGVRPLAITVTPDGATAYITADQTGFVEPLDVATNTFGAPIPVPITPTIIAITPDQAPHASFTVSVGAPGTATVFDASSSASPVGTIVSYAWSFGDGQTLVTTSPVISHTYATSGIFTVTLTVTNSAGTSTTKLYSGTMLIRNGGPNAVFTQSINVSFSTPTPPENFVGRVKKNEFATQTEYVHQLKWIPSTDPSVVGYLIRRNGILIAEINASGPFVFNDHNRKKREVDVYTIVSFNAAGMESSPLVVILSKKHDCSL